MKEKCNAGGNYTRAEVSTIIHTRVLIDFQIRLEYETFTIYIYIYMLLIKSIKWNLNENRILISVFMDFLLQTRMQMQDLMQN